MIANAVFVTTLFMLAASILLLQECQFLIPYRYVLFMKYGWDLAVFAAVLFVNLYAIVFLACRAFFLKDTGRKLLHLEKQLRSDPSLSEDLSRRLED